MARTAPAPDLPPTPGMCPSVAVLAGGGDGGGGSGGSAGDGGGNENAGAGSGGDNAQGDQKGAPSGSGDCGGSGGCPGNHPGNNGSASRGDPVDVVTGRVFTVPVLDLSLSGPIPLTWTRSYSSGARDRDFGLGHGWNHSLGWEVEVLRRAVRVWKGDGTSIEFPAIPVGASVLGREGWLLRREPWGFALDPGEGGDELLRLFSAEENNGRRYRLTALVDRNKNRIDLTYEEGRLVEIIDSGKRTVRVTSTREGRIASIAVKNAEHQGRWVVFATYTYNRAGDLTEVTSADGDGTSYTYDEDHLLTSQRDPTGFTFFYRYKGRRCVETWGEYPGGKDPSLAEDLPKTLSDSTMRAKGVLHVVLDYHHDGSSEVTDSATTQRFFANRFGKLDKAVSGGGVYTRTYDENGHILSFTDPLMATTAWGRDARGRVTRITDPLGRVTILNRDESGRVTEVIDRVGHVTRFDRDVNGNVLTILNPADGVSGFEYDTRGLCTAEIAPNGARTTYTYDAHGDITEMVLPNGAVYRWTYDAFGRVTSETDPLGGTARYAYSTGGRLVAFYDHDSGVIRYAYDGAGNLTRVELPGGGAYELTWGGYKRLCSLRKPDGAITRFWYNRDGRLVLVKNHRGDAHTLEYGTAGHVIRERTFDGRDLVYRHDAVGNLVRFRNGAGEMTELAYNLAGELTERRFADGTTESFTYDPRGDLAQISDGRSSVLFDRDPLRRILCETQVFDGVSHTVEVRHDALGNRVERKTSLGHILSIERDAMGHRRRVVLDGDHEVRQTPNLLGQEVLRELPGGGRIESTFDAVARLTGRRALAPGKARPVGPGEPDWIGPRSGQVAAAKAFRYAVGGELAEVIDQERGITTYRHDPLGQILAAVPERARAELFAYDGDGNVVEAGPGAQPREYGAGNRLIRRGAASYQYDREGRLIEKRVRRDDGAEDIWRYGWSAKGLLSSVRRADGALVEYAYDPLARRVEKRLLRPKASGGRPTLLVERTRYVWDGDVLVHAVKEAAARAGDPVVEEKTFCFEDESFVPFAHRDGAPGEGRWFHYFNDTAGAPDRLIAADGTVAASIERSVWGRAEAKPGAKTTTPLGFQGQYQDEETGLAYNRYRYYDPEAGRYISPDALGLASGFNDYAYGTNPVRSVDPLGLFPSAADYAKQKADQLKEQPGQKPNCVTAVVDKTTGKVWYGTPSGKKKENDLDMGTAHPFIKSNAEGLPPEGIAPHGQPPGNCGEPKAIDQALKAGAKPENLEMHTVYVGGQKHGQPKPRCPNCGKTTAGIVTTSDPAT